VQAITDKEIAKHLHQQYRQALSSGSIAATNNRRRLTNVRVIITEDVVRLRGDGGNRNQTSAGQRQGPRKRPRKR
jgi:hypothetical protein